MGQALCVCSRGTVSLGGARYLLLQRLAEGGFSYVDLVEGLRDGRFYALKRILCHDKEDRQAALHEVEMHNLFQHPNILRLEAHCLVEKGAKHEAWLLLPYVKGGTLWSEVEALREKGAFMPERRILLILHGICSGLQAIHSKGYAHRDLKPTNVLLDDDDRPILMDLGSMNRARMEVTSSREAMAVQVGAHSGGEHHPAAPSPASPLPLLRTGLPSAAPSPTVPPSSSRCPASASSMSTRISGLCAVLHDVRGGPLRRYLPEGRQRGPSGAEPHHHPHNFQVLGRLAPPALLHDDSEPPGAAQRRGHPTAAGGAAGHASWPGHHEHLNVARHRPKLHQATLDLFPLGLFLKRFLHLGESCSMLEVF
ncbi:serine/threonine-protein kinase 16 isoform X2 [Cyrtonyx montezumae]|uniref:serine/threonine-protein kinase 16 isoform X2 n=1 Tax=Cyrtonyx montezumae TaxID=9017 RepID=UPI0032DAA51F